MADNVNEESDYTPGKDELDWGYEEGRLGFLSMWRDAGDVWKAKDQEEFQGGLNPKLYTF